MPLPLALGVLALAHVFDWASFLVMIARHGLGAEANPIVVTLFEEAGVPGVTLAKLATVAFAGLLAVLLAPKRRRMAMVLLTFGVVAGLVGGFSNIATL
jgi:sugar phosphate permease